MKKRSRAFLAMLTAIAAVTLGTTACKKENPSYSIGIFQFTQHESLDAATQGFKDALTDKLGDSVTFDERNANGDRTTCTTVIDEFIYNDVDLILANSTTSLQITTAATSEIPILGTSVTDYGTALRLDDFDGTVGGNISGTSDFVPPSEQAALIKELFPEAKKIGTLYCSSEANSEYQAEALQKELKEAGYSCESYSFADSNDLSYAAEDAVAECDIIYIPTDNTIASCAGLISNICGTANIPVIAGEESTCRICGAATLTVDYYDLGYATGEMAAKILVDGEDISTMPIQHASSFTKKYNADICNQLGIKIPEDYVPLETE
jgi:putative ABC transport system substrate-binding protein